MKTRIKKSPRASANSEYKNRILNVLPSRNTETDWKFENARIAGALNLNATLPASVDLRADWWAIGDQGDTGSCVGWATADGVLRHYLVHTGKIGKTDRISARFIWMASKETDAFIHRPETFIEAAGTSLKAAMDIARKYGVPDEGLLPLNINTRMYAGRPDDLFAAAALNKIPSYINLRKNLADWRRWLAGGRPILAAFNVDLAWENASNSRGNLDRFQPGPNGPSGGHAIAVVGYTADRFILRNSWGSEWGDHGFAYATPEYINQAFYNESYAIDG